MANFCKSCCFDLFGVDISDFDGIISAEDYDSGMVANVLCEGVDTLRWIIKVKRWID